MPLIILYDVSQLKSPLLGCRMNDCVQCLCTTPTFQMELAGDFTLIVLWSHEYLGPISTIKGCRGAFGSIMCVYDRSLVGSTYE
jgi:hypothetical protein